MSFIGGPRKPLVFSGTYKTDWLKSLIDDARKHFPTILGEEAERELRQYTNSGVAAIVILQKLMVAPGMKANFPILSQLDDQELEKMKQQFKALDQQAIARSSSQPEQIETISGQIKAAFDKSGVSSVATGVQTTDTLEKTVFQRNIIMLVLDVVRGAVGAAEKEGIEARAGTTPSPTTPPSMQARM